MEGEPEMIDRMTLAELLNFPAYSRDASKVLHSAMYPYDSVQNMDFLNIAKEREISHDEYFVRAVHLDFADP